MKGNKKITIELDGEEARRIKSVLMGLKHEDTVKILMSGVEGDQSFNDILKLITLL